jgi:L-lactate utilization protein LutC
MTTRAEFFSRLRAALAGRPPSDPGEAAVGAPPHVASELLRRQLAERWPAALQRFREEFERVGGQFHRLSTLDELAPLVGHLLRERGLRRLVAWHPRALGADVAPGLRAEGLEVEVMPAERVTDEHERRALRERIARAELGLTGADLAVAETGTLVLVSGPGRPRSTALLPPVHVAVFDASALVESLTQVGVVLDAWHRDPAAAPDGAAIHFITGPSRTADIELTLTRGVHGPGEVHAVFVGRPIHG